MNRRFAMKKEKRIVTAGCDIGSTSGKAVILADGKLIAEACEKATTRPDRTARMVLDLAMKKAGLGGLKEIGLLIGTGYGRVKVSFADDNISEITCHSKGARFANERVRTVVDIGGQDVKVIALDDEGWVLDFLMNDKCAAGTGKFLEAMARALETDFAGLSELSEKSRNPAKITTQCSVFAESEVINLLNDDVSEINIAGGVHQSVASRVATLARKIKVRPDVAVTGGCAKSAGLQYMLEDRLGRKIAPLSVDPQLVGALGAAVIAAERLSAGRKRKAG